MKKGILYIVSTPIGNLEDITLRALRVLREVQLIAAEDTRRTKKLLNAYQIRTPLTSLYDHNELEKSNFLISKISDGMNVAYVSDAGTPGISDPGYILVNRAIENHVKVVPVPGISAVIAALSVSGLPMDHFVFNGFLPSRANKRREFLELLKDESRTMVFYESPNRLVSTLRDIEKIMGNREVVVSRELTKVFEEILRGDVRKIMDSLQERVVKGEITLVVAGKEKTPRQFSDEEIRIMVEKLREDLELTTRDIVDVISRETGLSKRRVYKQVLKLVEDV
ncbi:MAG: 16S rRNA (cytidine(1402)-2'-O)-methyltransferase [Syntrophales bacterium]|nr:16S rRNA (cytidine(1402)-2'-O)-methyltransferase [Syntrophales bacterium]